MKIVGYYFQIVWAGYLLSMGMHRMLGFVIFLFLIFALYCFHQNETKPHRKSGKSSKNVGKSILSVNPLIAWFYSLEGSGG